VSPKSVNALFSRWTGRSNDDPADEPLEDAPAHPPQPSTAAADGEAGVEAPAAASSLAAAPTLLLPPLPAAGTTPIDVTAPAEVNEFIPTHHVDDLASIDHRELADEVRRRLFGEVEPADLVAEEITAWFGSRKVLDRVSLTMKAGQVTALIGPSGCGKSTFLRILNRMHEMVPSASLAGEVRVDGQNIYDRSQKITDARRAIGMIFQKPNPFPAMSIYENVVAGLKLSGVTASKAYKDVLVEDSLRKASLWDEVKDRLDQPGGGLSGGQQQRLCIARSLAVSPRVLLMDEPCSALDPTSTRRVEETIEQLKGTTTIVIVTHNMQQASRVSDECAFFLAAQNTPGVIVEHGRTEAMFERPRDSRTEDYVNGRFG